ncbi:MAG: TonB-dependent receptor [Flavobacteriaceae bacterium]|nr:TonB-dependent receptor [Flavobacteriaceae bacterium]
MKTLSRGGVPLRTTFRINVGLLLVTFLAHVTTTSAQQTQLDSLYILPVQLGEVVVIGAAKKMEHQKQHKPLSTLDEYLEGAQHVNMVKRGAYAWEPVLNNMTSERLTVTIDGMQIFGACTDKMDPVTSYVDVSNLEAAEISSGQRGASFGNAIGGNINLKLENSRFKDKGWYGSFENAFESNNGQRVLGGEVNFARSNFYIDTDVIYRKADNYVAGGGEEVLFSQFEKYNFSVNSGYRVAPGQRILAALIYDEARDVGYPALPMDVSLARAVIASVSWEQDSLGNFTDWETKGYFNTIKHVMDDSQRPEVAIRMDMPGWSDTAGLYSQVFLQKGKHTLQFKIDGYYNRSLAEMTMYPANLEENPMFMLTWPDVRTFNTGLYLEDKLQLGMHTVTLGGRLGFHNNRVADDFGLKSLQIFSPEMEAANSRILKSISAQWHRHLEPFHLYVGGAYGERAPSVSEGYGFYLFNSFDNFDYIGDPNLKTEQAIEGNLKVVFEKSRWTLTAQASIFHMPNYIIGTVAEELSAMTMGASGVKIYENLESAQLINTSFLAECEISKGLKAQAGISWHRGTDSDGGNLPLISPWAYNANLKYQKQGYSATLSVVGNGVQENFNPLYGESQTAAYTVVAASMGKRFFISANDFYVKAGVENLFDARYSTYSDWNNIPRMGRNAFVALSYALN